MAASIPQPISASTSTNSRQHQQHNPSTGLEATSLSPSSSTSSSFLHPSQAASSSSHHSNSFKMSFSPPQQTNPIPLSQPMQGRQPSGHSNAFASGSGSYGAASLARSLMMGSYGNGSLEERMRMGSWKGKFLGNEGGLHQAWGGIDSHDFSHMSTSIGSNNGYMKNESDYSQNYNCCGLDLESMHDLLEHYEDVHVVILPSPATNASGLPEDVDSMELDSETLSSSDSGSSQTNSTHSNHHSPSLKRRNPIPASTPLQFSDVLAPPPGSSSSSAFDADSDAADGRKKTKLALAGRAAFSSTPGGAGGGAGQPDGEFRYTPTGSPVPPDISSMPSSSALPAPPSSNPASSLLAAAQAACNISPSGSAHITLPPGTINPSLDQSSGIPPPTRSGQKTFHCPTPGCQKSYKQQNGLKYHLKVGQCNFEVRDAVESGISEAEAEEKSRPFVCQVGGGCTKRYRQMNGLKYHYLNSGAHGAIGMALIAQGKHTHPKTSAGASLPGGDSNGFTSKGAGASGSPLAAGGVAAGGGASSAGGGATAWEQQQGQQQSSLGEVLFTAGDGDVDMEM